MTDQVTEVRPEQEADQMAYYRAITKVEWPKKWWHLATNDAPTRSVCGREIGPNVEVKTADEVQCGSCKRTEAWLLAQIEMGVTPDRALTTVTASEVDEQLHQQLKDSLEQSGIKIVGDENTDTEITAPAVEEVEEVSTAPVETDQVADVAEVQKRARAATSKPRARSRAKATAGK